MGFYASYYDGTPRTSRLGEAFLTQFYYPQLNDFLYYEESDESAREMIESTYIEERIAA